MPRLQLEQWQAQHCRLTAFPMPAATVRSTEWWEQVTGQTADEQTANPKKGTSQVSGAFGPGKLALGLEVGRIDWSLLPQDFEFEVVPTEREFPIVGQFTETVGFFTDIATRWLTREDIPELQRIAFGAVLIHVEEDRVAGYRRLPDYVPVRVDPESSSDFSFQVNVRVPSQSGIEGLQINRLSKWSILRLIGFRFTAGVAGPQALLTGDPVHAFRIELDINTVPEFEGPLPRERLRDLFTELVQLASDIATNGLLNNDAH